MPEAPIFIVGCPRSGTGLLRDLLRAHPAIAIPAESHFIPELYRAYGDPRNEREAIRIANTIEWHMGWKLGVDRDALAPLRSSAAIIDLIFGHWAQQQGKRRWGDKTPQYVLELPTLRTLFPGCKTLHIYRDGRDVTVSLLRSHIGPENTLTAAKYWRRLVNAGRSLGRALPAGMYHEVRYECLLDDPEQTMRDVCAFVEEPFTPAVLRPDYLERRARPLIVGKRRHAVASKTEIVRTNQGLWKKAMAPEDVETFESVAGDLLRVLGYEAEQSTIELGFRRRAWAHIGHVWWYLLYRLNLGEKRRWARLTLWMWRAKARYVLRLLGLAGPPIQRPPRPAGRWPLIGHAPSFLRDKLGFLSRCVAEHGDVVELSIGTRTYLLNHPDDIAHILIGNHSNYGKSHRLTSAGGRRLAGAGLLTTSPNGHGPKRRLLRPLFHRETMVQFGATIVRNTRQTLAAWQDDAVFDIEEPMARLTRRNIVAALFSADTRGSAARLDRAIVARQRYIEYVFAALLPFPEYRPMPVTIAYRGAIRTIDRFIDDAIEQRRDAPGPADLLSMLLAARYEDGTAMTDTEVRDEALVFSLTGYETVGEALTWTLHLLSEHPDVADEARAEIDTTLGDRPAEADDASRLPYLSAVLAESMRLYPPTWIQVRMALGDDELPSGARVPAGSKLYLSQWVTHRSPQHFPDPDRFDPGRFLAEPLSHPKNAYFPFGLGPRRCLGETFANMEAPLVLATILQSGALTTVPGQRIVPQPGLILRPRRGLKMRYRLL